MNQSKLPTYLPWIAVGVTLLYFGYRAMPKHDPADEFHYRKFGLVPTLEDGRYKPMDTYARNSLMVITSRQQYYDYKTGEYRPDRCPRCGTVAV